MGNSSTVFTLLTNALLTEFTVWTTYTDGHPIGADNALAASYLSTPRIFASLSRSDIADIQTPNRSVHLPEKFSGPFSGSCSTRLVGLSAVTAALNPEALFKNSVQFRAQVAVILNSIIFVMLQSEILELNEQYVRSFGGVALSL